MNARPVFDNVLVEVDSEWKSEIQGKNGIVGVVFENDLDRSVGAQRRGRVVRTPRKISEHHYLSSIRNIVQEGDVVYFHFNSIVPDTRVQFDLLEKPLYLVNMEGIFVIVRDGKIIMNGDRILCEPLFDEDVVEEDGVKVRKTKSGIITEINVKHDLKKARLAHIGEGFIGKKPVNANVGDVVYYDVDADFENEIEGKKYFCMVQEDLLMKQI
jgi:co-chaperonin GroES (HSP10)